jgi:predicted enzyme related to lactoylglutathione lyase
MKISGVDTTFYRCTDYGRATKFYTDLFGVAPTTQFEPIVSEWTFPGGESFGVYKGDEFKPSNGVMFHVPDVKAAADELRKRGIAVHTDVEETPVCHMAFVTDSEGNGFILHRRKDATD